MGTIMASELDPNHFPQIGIELKNCSEVYIEIWLQEIRLFFLYSFKIQV